MDGVADVGKGPHDTPSARFADQAGTSIRLQPDVAARSSSPLLQPSSKGRRSEASAGSGGRISMRMGAGRKQGGKGSRIGRGMTAKKHDDLLTAAAVPRG